MPFNLSPEELPLADIAHQDRDRLTFGIEFEFAIATLEKEQDDPSLEDGLSVFGVSNESDDEDSREFSVLTHIAKTLTDAGIKSVEGFETDSVDEDDVTLWIVKNDHSVHGPEKKNPYTWYSIEVITPAFYFSADAINTVKSVCEILTNSYRLNCNPTSGMHVHVGRGEKSFAFETLRSLYSTLWTFEPQIKQIHPYYRHETETYSVNLRNDNSIFEENIEGDLSPVEVVKGLDSILNSQDTGNLGSLVVGEGRNTYNILGILLNLEEEKKKKDTVEFRQHESTLNPIRVELGAALHWAL